jgi:SNF2 family DNA or RNA helicase
LERKRAILADDPGLGKTRQALLAARGRTLIISPAMLRRTWQQEQERWAPELDITWVSYSDLCHRVADKAGRLSKVMPLPRPQYRQAWDTVICDEAHYLKGRATAWTRAVLWLAERCNRLYLLTGTPVPNWAHEIYMPLRLLHPKAHEVRSYWRWVETWFNIWKPEWGGHKVLGLKKGVTWEAFVRGNRLHTDLLRRTREQVLPDLPPLTETTLELEMTLSQAKLYRSLKKDYLAWTDSGHEVSAWSAGGLHTKLMQITTGPEVLDPMARPGCKAGAVEQLLEERRHQPTVIFTHFRATAEFLWGVAHGLGIAVGIVTGGHGPAAREGVLEQFRTGEITVLVGTLDTLAEGLTLTQADTCILVEHSWRPSRNEQAMRRLHRIGQSRPVTVIHLVTAGTVDVGMQSLLSKKSDQQASLLTAAEFARLL